MPQASSELRDIMSKVFGGDGIDDNIPMKFLASRGYTLTPTWQWRLPTPEHWVTDKEELCIRFLIEEWDFGGTVGHAPPTP